MKTIYISGRTYFQCKKCGIPSGGLIGWEVGVAKIGEEKQR